MADFEKKFFQKTSNKWIEKNLFQQKPGMFGIMNREDEI